MIYVILEALDLQYVKQFTLNKIVLFKIFKNIYIHICIFVVDSKLFFVDSRNPLLDLGILHLVIIITLSSPFRLYVLGQGLEGDLKKMTQPI